MRLTQALAREDRLGSANQHGAVSAFSRPRTSRIPYAATPQICRLLTNLHGFVRQTADSLPIPSLAACVLPSGPSLFEYANLPSGRARIAAALRCQRATSEYLSIA